MLDLEVDAEVEEEEEGAIVGRLSDKQEGRSR